MDKLYFAAVKMYKGLFRKKFEKNNMILVVPTKGRFSLVLGYMGNFENLNTGEDYKLAVLIQYLPKVLIDNFFTTVKETYSENFVMLDDVKVTSIKANPDGSSVQVKVEKGSYLKGSLTFNYLPNISDTSHRIYSVEGYMPDLFYEENLEMHTIPLKASDIKSQYHAFLNMTKAGTEFNIRK